MTDINMRSENGTTVLALAGRLDSAAAPAPKEAVCGILGDTRDLVFDLSDLAYISSAGLRVIPKAQKAMNVRESMKITGANDSIMDVFDTTGFLNILNIE